MIEFGIQNTNIIILFLIKVIKRIYHVEVYKISATEDKNLLMFHILFQ